MTEKSTKEFRSKYEKLRAILIPGLPNEKMSHSLYTNSINIPSEIYKFILPIGHNLELKPEQAPSIYFIPQNKHGDFINGLIQIFHSTNNGRSYRIFEEHTIFANENSKLYDMTKYNWKDKITLSFKDNLSVRFYANEEMDIQQSILFMYGYFNIIRH